MGRIYDPLTKILYKIPDADRILIDEVSAYLDNLEAMTVNNSIVPWLPGPGTKYFRVAGETRNANSWQGAGYFQYSDNGVTLVTQIDNAGYIFNQQGGNIDFRIEGDTDTDLFFVDASTDRIGIGTSSPQSTLHISDGNAIAAALITTDYRLISAQGSPAGASIIVSGADPLYRGVFKGVRSRGTLASPTVPSSGDSVFSVLGAIYDGVNVEGTAQIDFIVDGNVSSNVAPQRIAFMTSETIGTSRVERLKIHANGTIVVNDDSADADFRIEGNNDANLFTLDAGSDAIALGGAVNASYKLKVYGSTAIDKTYTAATAGEHIVKITATDSVTQTAGMLQTLLVDHNITGAKSGSAHSEGISVDMNIGSNTNTAYASAVYISQSGNPNSSVIEGMNIYLEDMGSGTLSNILGLDIGINSTNVASGRHAGMRIRNHSGTAPDAILIETGFTNVLTINPGVDADINLIKLGVAGTPTIGWAETPDVFTSNKGWNITGASTIGDGGTTNYAAFAADGDLTFVGTAGLVFGELYVAAAGDELTITTAGQVNKIQITSFDTAGVSNNMTPSAASDDITVLVAGMYLCTVSLHIETAALGGADTFGFSVYKNDGHTEFPNVHGHRQLAGGGGDVGSVSLSGIIDLAEDDTIELWAWNEDSTDNIIIQDVTLSLVMIGGT